MKRRAEVSATAPALRSGLYALLLLPISFALHACAEESPTDVGGSLLPPDALRTFEVIVDPAGFYDIDTTFTGFDETRTAQFRVVANEFGGVFEANTLVRFSVPSSIGTADSTGAVVTDTMPTLLGGRVVIALDTARSDVELPVSIGLYRVVEEWDPASADWTNRVDTAGITLPWTVPGARGGAFVDSVVWSSENVDTAGVPVDSLVIPIDSQTVAIWADSTQVPGAVLVMETSGARVRIADVVLRLDARPSVKPDTVVTTTVRPVNPIFIYDPPVEPQPSILYVGGIPEWRSYIRWRDGIDTLLIPCPQVSTDCVVRLGDADINYAALILELAASPPGFLLQDSLRIISAPVLASPLTPLERSPLGRSVGVGVEFLSPSRFVDPVDDRTEVPVTPYLSRLLADTTSDGSPVSPWMAVLPLVTGFDLGLAAFEPNPRLRLVLTVARELQLR